MHSSQSGFQTVCTKIELPLHQNKMQQLKYRCAATKITFAKEEQHQQSKM
jgi:hypothetical protein